MIGNLEAPPASAKTKEVTKKTYVYNDKGQRTALIQEVFRSKMAAADNLDIQKEYSSSTTRSAPSGQVTRIITRQVPKDASDMPPAIEDDEGAYSYRETGTYRAHNRTEDETVTYDETELGFV